MIPNNTFLVLIRNRGNFISQVFINFLINGQIITATTPAINPEQEYTGRFPKQGTDFHMIFHNNSVPGSPVFDEQVREHGVNSCFLLTGDANYPICIPVPCSSLNYCNNYCNYCNCCNCKNF